MSDETTAGPVNQDAPAREAARDERTEARAAGPEAPAPDADSKQAEADETAPVPAAPTAPVSVPAPAGEPATGATGVQGEPVTSEAPAAEVAPAGAALFSAEYDTTLDLLTSYVDLLVGPKQRRFALVMSVIDVVLALVVAIAAASLWPVALVLFALGIGMLWYRSNICRLTASKMLRGLDPSEMHRHVHVYDDRVDLVKGDGSTDTFPLAELTDVPHDDRLLVLAFGRSGVTVPNGSLTAGTYEDLLTWARERIGTEGSSPR